MPSKSCQIIVCATFLWSFLCFWSLLGCPLSNQQNLPNDRVHNISALVYFFVALDAFPEYPAKPVKTLCTQRRCGLSLALVALEVSPEYPAKSTNPWCAQRFYICVCFLPLLGCAWSTQQNLPIHCVHNFSVSVNFVSLSLLICPDYPAKSALTLCTQQRY